MITEDYVSLETAKLLKEKGFDEECIFAYPYENHVRITQGYPNSYWNHMNVSVISAPTLQMGMKWLREKYGLHCSVIFHLHNDWEPCILEFHNDKVPKNYLTSCDTYEEACDAAIKYCLENLI